MAEATVAIVIPCYNQARFLGKALRSCFEQTVMPDEVIVVDDGSKDEPSRFTKDFPQVRLIRQENRGRSGAKNAGLREAASDKIIFLDADDLLQPYAIASGLACFRANPNAGFVYGGFAVVTRKSRENEFQSVSSHRDLVKTNWVGMIAAVMFDRLKLLDCGGFDEELGMCEDWDLFLRMSRKFPFASHPDIVADYVRHDSNITNDIPKLREWIDVVRSREWKRGLDSDGQRAWQEGEAIWATRVPNPSPMTPIERRARKAARTLLRPFRT